MQNIGIIIKNNVTPNKIKFFLVTSPLFASLIIKYKVYDKRKGINQIYKKLGMDLYYKSGHNK